MTAPRKFRVFDGEEMHYPPHSYFRSGDGTMLYYRRVMYNILGPDYHYDVREDCDVDDMDYTGLDDAEGTEIYEGDIVDFNAWRGIVTIGEFRCVLQVDRQMTFKGVHLRGIDNGNAYPLSVDELEPTIIVGNRYETPELLEEVA